MGERLEGRVALVTGSSGGIGSAIALELARRGARVVVHGRDEARARSVASEVATRGGHADVVIGPLDTDAGAARVIEAVHSEAGSVDVLVNNAGGFEVCSWWDGSPDRWIDVYEVNVGSAVRMIQGLVPGMKERGWGRVIQVSSVSATLAPPLFPDYAAAKAAMLNVTVSLAKELAGSGVTVNTVSPGATLTGAWEAFARQIGEAQGWEDDLDGIKDRLLGAFLANPSGRFGEPADVANAVAFLADPRSGYVNGVNLRVDGGLAAVPA